MEASKRDYEKVEDFQLNDAPDIVLYALYLTYQSRTYSCCFRFFCCCCVPAVEDFTAASLRAAGETVLADLVAAVENVRVKSAPSQRTRALHSNPQLLLQGEIQKTKEIIEGVKNKTHFPDLHEDYINAIRDINDPIFSMEDSRLEEEHESFDSINDL